MNNPNNQNNPLVERLLKQKIKPTTIRLLVLKCILDRKEVFSLSDLENELDTVDKSNIFRTLKIFNKQGLIHSIDDGSGSLKYSICEEDCTCALYQLHVHFYCRACKQTYCFRDIPIPLIQIPDGFSTDSANYVIKGLCNNCN